MSKTRKKDAQGKWVDGDPTWLNVIVFGRQAEMLVESNAGKGTRLLVAGRLENRPWTDREGNERQSLELTAAKRIDPAVMVTHIGGLNAAAETTLNLPKIPGGKKLIYTHLTMPLIALTDLRAKGEQDNDPRYTALADIVDAHNGLWCPEAEEYLLANFNPED